MVFGFAFRCLLVKTLGRLVEVVAKLPKLTQISVRQFTELDGPWELTDETLMLMAKMLASGSRHLHYINVSHIFWEVNPRRQRPAHRARAALAARDRAV